MSTILFVDDEPQILRSLSRLFTGAGYDVRAACCGGEALEICDASAVDLIVSDMRMPEISGLELLREVKRRHPETVRMLLSGYADEGAITEALLHDVATASLLKPWDNDELVRTVGKALDTRDMLASAKLLSAINGLEQLPTLQPYLQEILAAIDADEDIAAISAKIERDHAISSKVLQLVNSAYYGVKTGSVRKAVSFLGLHSIRNLILSASIMDSFRIGGAGRRFVEAVWAHSYMTNRIQQAIFARHPRGREFRALSSAGLLHNIGIVFLLRHAPEQYLQVIADARGAGAASLSALETERFGFTHGQAGGYILQWWNLPYPVVEAAAYHDNPLDGRVIHRELACAVHIAQYYASGMLGIPPDCDFQEGSFEGLGMERSALESEIETVKGGFRMFYRPGVR